MTKTTNAEQEIERRLRAADITLLEKRIAETDKEIARLQKRRAEFEKEAARLRAKA